MRIAVMAIAGLMVFSTGALFVGMALGSNNQAEIEEILLAERNAKIERLNYLLSLYGEELAAAADETNERYFATFAAFRSEVSSFVPGNVTELHIRDLVVGDGDPLTDISQDNSLLYLGWLGDSTVFDSSFELNNSDDPNAWRTATRVRFPDAATPQFITGFKEGLIGRAGGSSTGARLCTDGTFATPERDCPSIVEGMRVGGVRIVTIPHQKAYGDGAFGNIPPFSPLRFLIMRVPFVLGPEPSEELFDLYVELYG
jgi:FKBP-type peptidyl-prolyl cis-trans isomerase